MMFSNGDVYNGEWRKGLPHGYGVYSNFAMRIEVFGGTLNPMGTLSGGLRPGTNMMMRPGSQMRPGSTRMQAVGVGGSLQQPIAVTAAAPIAREGMRAASRSGLGTSAGPGRQVGDRSYYIGLLRPKNTELTT
ncbi:hypothetical protein O3M35_013321 [Rhynocoris fuscipes]|uniref:Uncharacterized protein n=1 Tax=Rhynocoris fuscipes TaxID=488301 RepID=A0AAW1CF61_9HEMI